MLGDVPEIAIQAALTGHLVFSTLHTNDAPSTVTRMLNMGIEPFLVASSVEALIAQRLVEREGTGRTAPGGERVAPVEVAAIERGPIELRRSFTVGREYTAALEWSF